MRYYLTTLQIGYNQKTASNKSAEEAEKKEPSTVLVGIQIGVATVEIRMEVSKKKKLKWNYQMTQQFPS